MRKMNIAYWKNIPKRLSYSIGAAFLFFSIFLFAGPLQAQAAPGISIASTTGNAPPSATLSLNATKFQPGMPLKATVVLSGAHASAAQRIVFSIVGDQGVAVATSSEAVSGSVVQHLFAPGSLSAGSYKLEARVMWATGSTTELNAPFTVATSSAYALHGSWWWLLLVLVLVAWWLWYQRRRRSQE